MQRRFHEFPKAVYLPGQVDPAIVESAEEEAELLASVSEEEEAAEPDGEEGAVAPAKRRGRPPKR